MTRRGSAAGGETFSVVNSTIEMAAQLEAVQRASFPTLAEGELITAAHYAAHVRRFPEGQFAVVTDGGLVVACSTDFRTHLDLGRIEHRYIDAADRNWLGHHDPGGDWLYGADIGVLPAFRRRGLARLLYDVRHALVRRLGLRGHVAGSMLRGYGQWKGRIAVDEYVARVVAGELVDPTLTVQLRCGFRVHGIIQDYVTDPSCDNKAALIIWENPDWPAADRTDAAPRRPG
jgi:GNAT superfamily N-acetyltransferase